MQLGRSCLCGVDLSEDVQLRCRREVQQLLEFSHRIDLMAAVQDVDTLLGGDYVIAVEIRPTLLKFGEVLDGLQRAQRAEKPLDVDVYKRQVFLMKAAPNWTTFYRLLQRAKPKQGTTLELKFPET